MGLNYTLMTPGSPQSKMQARFSTSNYIILLCGQFLKRFILHLRTALFSSSKPFHVCSLPYLSGGTASLCTSRAK